MKNAHDLLVSRPYPKLISLVIPCYNEEQVLPLLREQLTAFLPRIRCDVEVILVDDGSNDRTRHFLREWSLADDRVLVLGLSRNFGHQIAVTAGLDAAEGDAVVVMDADLQDPLEVILEMINRFEQGFDVVYGQRVKRQGETLFKLLSAWLFYRIMQKFVHRDLPVDVGDFRLLSRDMLNAMKSMREQHRFLRGMAAWAGFHQTPVKYQRHPRAAGSTKYPLSKMLRFSWTAAISFSTLPLKMAMFLGIVVTLVGISVGCYAVVQVVAFRLGYAFAAGYNPGWASLITLICVIGGTILLCLGVIGEYIGRIYEEVKARPLYFVSQRFKK